MPRDTIVDFSSFTTSTYNSNGNTYTAKYYNASGTVTASLNGNETNFPVKNVVYYPSNPVGSQYDLLAQTSDGHILNFQFADQSPTSINFENAAIASTPPNPPSVNYSEHTTVSATTTDVVCFVTGTLIRTTCGDVAVEDLAVGDLLPTLHGGIKPVRWIGSRRHDGATIANQLMALPVCIKAGALAEGVPVHDLHVSPGHAIYLDGVLVHAYRLINGVSVVQAEAVESVTYWHVELDDHEVIFAEGCAAESYLDIGNRDSLESMADHPDRRARPLSKGPIKPCAPLLEEGFHLDVIHRRVAARAGLDFQAVSQPGLLSGCVDSISNGVLLGWARNEVASETPVCLDIVVDGQRFARVLANRYRGDVREAGLGSGFSGFTALLPRGVEIDRVAVFRAIDGLELKNRLLPTETLTANMPNDRTLEARLRLVHSAA